MTRPTHLLRIPVLLTVQSAMVVVLLRLGRVPALRIDAASPGPWLAGTPPVDALAAVLRLVALGLAAWLLFSTMAYLLARLSSVPSLVRATARVTLPAVRRVVERSVAAGVLASTLAAPVPAGAQPVAPPPPPPDAVVRTAGGALLPPGVAPPTGARPDAEPDPAAADRTPDPMPTIQQTPIRPTPNDRARASDRRVAPGDNLWTIAERHLAAARGTEPDLASVAHYWRRLVTDNRDTLRSGDPDLIHPGETVSLPPVSSPPVSMPPVEGDR